MQLEHPLAQRRLLAGQLGALDGELQLGGPQLVFPLGRELGEPLPLGGDDFVGVEHLRRAAAASLSAIAASPRDSSAARSSAISWSLLAITRSVAAIVFWTVARSAVRSALTSPASSSSSSMRHEPGPLRRPVAAARRRGVAPAPLAGRRQLVAELGVLLLELPHVVDGHLESPLQVVALLLGVGVDGRRRRRGAASSSATRAARASRSERTAISSGDSWSLASGRPASSSRRPLFSRLSFCTSASARSNFCCSSANSAAGRDCFAHGRRVGLRLGAPRLAQRRAAACSSRDGRPAPLWHSRRAASRSAGDAIESRSDCQLAVSLGERFASAR